MHGECVSEPFHYITRLKITVRLLNSVTETTTMKPLNHENFLNETYCYFSMNPHMRAADTHSCKYRINTPDGVVRKCAVGRYIPDDVYDPLFDSNGGSKSLDYIFRRISRSKLTPALININLIFLQRVQSFHDESSLWVDTEVSRRKRYNTYQKLLEEARDNDDFNNRFK